MSPREGLRAEVPEGSSVHDLTLPRVAEKGKDRAKKPSGDTSASATSILDTHRKRPRPGCIDRFQLGAFSECNSEPVGKRISPLERDGADCSTWRADVNANRQKRSPQTRQR